MRSFPCVLTTRPPVKLLRDPTDAGLRGELAKRGMLESNGVNAGSGLTWRILHAQAQEFDPRTIFEAMSQRHSLLPASPVPLHQKIAERVSQLLAIRIAQIVPKIEP